MKAIIALVLVASATACAHGGFAPAGVRQASPSDFNFDHADDTPCVARIATPSDPKFADECKRMSKPEYYHGVWRVEFEGSDFTFWGSKPCYETGDIQNCIDRAGKALPWPSRWECSREFEVEFIGRRSILPGPYLHMGVPGYRVVVDRLISAKRRPDPYDENCDSKLHPELKARK